MREREFCDELKMANLKPIDQINDDVEERDLVRLIGKESEVTFYVLQKYPACMKGTIDLSSAYPRHETDKIHRIELGERTYVSGPSLKSRVVNFYEIMKRTKR